MKFPFSKINSNNVAGFMHCYARMLVRILPLLRQTYNVFSVMRKKPSLVYFSRQGTGSPWSRDGRETADDTEAKKALEMHKCIYMYTHTHTEDCVNTRKFSAFAPQLSSSFRVHSIYLLGISWCASPDKQKIRSLCALLLATLENDRYGGQAGEATGFLPLPLPKLPKQAPEASAR